ncbi:MAG TPA: YbaB/EbfC family nucleoid-associated protein [Bacillota bacterium]|nr:YbaB/EbfC family nucleoid-associated protein [Bacillota bacterium]
MVNNIGAIIAEIQKLREESKKMTVEVSEGDGVFRIVMNGHQEVLEVRFEPSVLSPGNADALEAAVCNAVNRAIAESKLMIKNEVAKITGGMGLPNIQGLF